MTPRKPKAPRAGKIFRNLRKILLVFSIILLLAFIGVGAWVISVAAKTPKWDPTALYDQKQSSRVYDMNGSQIAQLHAGENRLTAKSSDIPDLVKKTFVAVEDKRFYSHFGVDPIRIIGSALHDIVSRSKKEGASTITIQLARNAFIEDPTAKTLTRKIQEAVLAMQLEHKYTKDEILTFYLNKIFFGESSFGIRAAAQTYFGKDDLAKLTPDEVALLAGLPQAPSQYDPYVHPEDAKYRRNIVLGIMKDANIISAADYAKYKDVPFAYVDNVKKTSGGAQKTAVASVDYKFPYFVDYVIEELESNYHLSEDQIFNGGLQIYTTVDPKIQTEAEKAFADPNNFPKSVDDKNKIQGAMTVIEPATGAIRAMVGGRDYTPRGLNRAWNAKRQPGSTIKPLVVYGPALEKGGYFPGTVLDDMPVKYNAGNGEIWAPVDFDTEDAGWKGLITMRYALEDSVNVYAVKLMNLIGVDYGWKFGKEKLGLPLADDEKYNLSLALGTTHVSTLDMAAAYGVYANNGVRVDHHAVEKVLDSQGNPVLTPKINKQRVMKETTAYLINDLLRSVVTDGTGYRAQIANWAVAGKTGTTSLDPKKYGTKSGNPDAWFAGYTPLYAGVVWMGYDSDPDGNHYLRKVYGGSYPAQIWKQVMTAALQGKQIVSTFPQPAGIVSGTFDRKSGLLPSSLTPSQFIATEIAAQGDFPTKVSSVWIQKEVDADHPNLLAGPATKNKLTKVFLDITGRDPSIPWPADEAPYKPPSEISQAPAEPAASATTPPAGDPKIPAPTLGPVAYDGRTYSVTVPLTCPAGSEQFAVVLYLKRPGNQPLETVKLKNVTPLTPAITVQLTTDNKAPAPGDYVFWAALQDPATGTVGAPSLGSRLTLTD